MPPHPDEHEPLQPLEQLASQEFLHPVTQLSEQLSTQSLQSFLLQDDNKVGPTIASPNIGNTPFAACLKNSLLEYTFSDSVFIILWSFK